MSQWIEYSIDPIFQEGTNFGTKFQPVNDFLYDKLHIILNHKNAEICEHSISFQSYSKMCLMRHSKFVLLLQYMYISWKCLKTFFQKKTSKKCDNLRSWTVINSENFVIFKFRDSKFLKRLKSFRGSNFVQKFGPFLKKRRHYFIIKFVIINGSLMTHQAA